MEEERDQVARDRDQARQGREAAERELATTAADINRVREQLGMVTKDRDVLQADQIQWGLDREQLLTSETRLKERVSSLDADLANERAEHQALQTRHAEDEAIDAAKHRVGGFGVQGSGFRKCIG